MAGHSKWANIKHRKAAQDKIKGKTWSKLIREVTVAARQGGSGDPMTNPRLRLAVDKAYAQNMQRDTIERAIARGVGDTEGMDYEEIRYEGYGPGGTAVMAQCMTNNRNRTAGDVRHAFTKYGGNLGTDGSVAYLFTHQGILSFAPGTSEDALLEAALEAGADDVVGNEDGSLDVITQPETFSEVKDALAAAGFEGQGEVTFYAATRAELGQDDAERLLKMIEMLEELDDVQEVYSNADIAPEILDALG
jgi:YebC/PmpR family DNA-binding regulatory protein